MTDQKMNDKHEGVVRHSVQRLVRGRFNPCLRCRKTPRLIDWCQCGDGDDFDFEVRCCGVSIRGQPDQPHKGLNRAEARSLWNERNSMIHVYPLNDEDEHETEGTMCRCRPRVEWSDPETGDPYAKALVIHQAFDWRHVVEEAERISANAKGDR